MAEPPKPFKLTDLIDPTLTAKRFELPLSDVEDAILVTETTLSDEVPLSPAQIELSQSRRGSDLHGYLRAVFDKLASERGYSTYDEFAAQTLLTIASDHSRDRKAAISALREINRLLYPEVVQEIKRSLPTEDREEILSRLKAAFGSDTTRK